MARGRPKLVTPEMEARIAELALENVKGVDIARQIGLDHGTVSRVRRSLGIPKWSAPPKLRQVRKKAGSTINHELRNKVAHLIQLGHTLTAVAAEAGVSKERIRQVVTWNPELRSEYQRLWDIRKATRLEARKRVPPTLDALVSEMVAKFNAKIDRRGFSDCWEFKGMKTPAGYGRFQLRKPVANEIGLRTLETAHRVAWAIENGHIPLGMTIDHICFNRSCCNPNHLQVLSKSANSARKQWKILGLPNPSNSCTGPKPETIEKYARVRSLVAQGLTVERACSEVGLPLGTHHNHRAKEIAARQHDAKGAA